MQCDQHRFGGGNQGSGRLTKRRANIGQGDHQRHRLMRASVKPEGQVKLPRLLRDRVDNNPANPNSVGGMRHTERRVSKQYSTDASSMKTTVDREPGEDNNWNRIGHVAPESAGSAFRCDRARGERIIADHTRRDADHVSARGSADLIRMSPPIQPIVERWLTTAKFPGVMQTREWLRRTYFSHGAAVWSDLRKRAFGRGGASSFFRKSA